MKFRKDAVVDGKAVLPRAPGHPEQKAIGGKTGALRAAIFGANDGLVSNLSLIMGVAGATSSKGAVLIAGIAGLLAGSFSMAAGEFVSMRVQRDVYENLLEFERDELETMPEAELRELIGIYEKRGLPEDLARRTAEIIHADPKLALATHAWEELGLDPEDLGSPWAASMSSFSTFAVGALIPLAPFFFGSGTAAIVAAAVLAGVTLFVIGGAMTMFTGRNFVVQGLKMLGVGAAAAIITNLIGRLLHATGVA